ncbi:MAG: hypothetical protein A2622_06090 [Bdellovibrionales bacterium RIFCSPHIGHO2_01_FULL_40_29]|nr:MAG: hypothetical protein A2622_06090 [Bdellovibrionales bacterium RIFCSPHIGHO2_01_FULL_40_29]OFZ35019.1 MAG: hypothetical protein A3D17_06440 [Bdellovibrionales bacterium RIFCSPHIGHO2_02_FULL_40_15]
MIFSFQILAQESSPAITDQVNDQAVATPEEDTELPNARRIRRHLNLIIGVEHDEEFLIPEKELIYKGRVDFFDMKRIKGTDFFRISPKKVGNGIVTIHNKKTGQILVELRFDIRNDDIEKTLREAKSLLGDIEGIEFKLVNGIILLDGYALIPKDLIRIAQVLKTFGDQKIRSLVTLSPIARKKIAEYISRDVNNPEVSITAVGDYLKLEGVVNSEAEKNRIIRLVSLYMPDIVIENAPDTEHIKIVGRKSSGKIEELIIDLITVKKDEEKSEPPPKMIQIVAHFVEYNERYLKNFSFEFSPRLSQVDAAARQPAGGSLTELAQLIERLLPKLNWAKKHGYARVLDTGSILVQDKQTANLQRDVTILKGYIPGENGAQTPDIASASLLITTVPTIKSERSGLIELKNLTVRLSDPNENGTATTNVTTTISVRDRQSAAFAGTIKKKKDADFGGPTGAGAIITLNQGKNYSKNTSNFVVFVTPIIKASASSGVDQVKKKFRLKD